MARRKAQSPGEVLIAFFATASEADARALLLTASTITAARFPPPVVTKKPTRTRKPSTRELATAVATGQVLGNTAPAAPALVSGIHEAAAAQSPRRRRPPVAAPAAPTNSAAPGAGNSPTQAAGPVDITLPDQGDPEDRG